MSTKALHCIISGFVQGISFRARTKEKARQLGLTGWVRNCDDGTVEVMAVGDPIKLATLREWLNVGPPAARVERVDQLSAQPKHFEQFEIIR